MGSIYKVLTPSNVGSSWPALVLLHGMGTNEEDLLPLKPYLPDNWGLITLRAPYTVGPQQYQWYHLQELGKPEPNSLSSSLDLVEHFLLQLGQEVPGVDLGKVVLGGFSQGALISGALLQRMVARGLAGTAILSGYLPESVGLTEPLHNYPVFWGHGEEDMVLPLDWGNDGVIRLRSLGAQVTFCTYPQMGHSVNEDELQDLSDWLQTL
ncbi:MAG: hypothetical protein C7B46_06275 [Sulfobacillus benefaciens]|uniref:Phospholipase/carboxylesterase/thioesterase domain-containing protein n=1 Tax=Sulfobacillus benefaciens TaxID=453960 RepID=A0A2T2XIQ7_9FIRM|nr:MAG: hypothetical protein C7B46_06275 [Sulfobacillus benefaciens]